MWEEIALILHLVAKLPLITMPDPALIKMGTMRKGFHPLRFSTHHVYQYLPKSCTSTFYANFRHEVLQLIVWSVCPQFLLSKWEIRFWTVFLGVVSTAYAFWDDTVGWFYIFIAQEYWPQEQGPSLSLGVVTILEARQVLHLFQIQQL